MELPRLTRDAHVGIIIRGYTKKIAPVSADVLQVGLCEKFCILFSDPAKYLRNNDYASTVNLRLIMALFRFR